MKKEINYLIKIMFFVFILVFLNTNSIILSNSLAFNAYQKWWSYEEDFVSGEDKFMAMPHGIVVTPDEKIWVGFYTYSEKSPSGEEIYPLWIYNPDGSLHKKLESLIYQGNTATIRGNCRGLSLDNNGNVLFSEHDKLWRINYKNYEVMNKVIPSEGISLTEAACDENGYIYITHVVPNGKPLYIYNKNFVLINQVDASVQTVQRSIVVSSDGKDVYLGRIYGDEEGNGIIHYHGDNGPAGDYKIIETIQPNIWGQCLDWDQNGLLWIGSYWDVGINELKGWYALDSAQNWKIVASVGENYGFLNHSIPIPPEGTYYAPRGAAWSDDGLIMYTADFEGHVIKKWIRSISVSIPDTSAAPGDTINIPIFVGDVTETQIKSVDLSIELNSNILTPTNVHSSGTLSENWGDPNWYNNNGNIVINLLGTTPLTGSGPIIFICCHVNPNAAVGDTCTLHLADILFNEGDPPAETQDGLFTVIGNYEISGNINYFANNQNVNNLQVSLTGDKNLTDTTDADGNYTFSQLPQGNFVLKPAKAKEHGQAISPFDAAMVLQSYVDIIQLSPYQKIAADVSGNGQITPYDAAQILQYWVGLIPNFPVMPDSSQAWTFVPTSFPIDESNWSDAPDSLSYKPLDSDKADQDFVGIIYGDPSGNWRSGALAKSTEPNRVAEVGMGNIHWEKDNMFTIALEISRAANLYCAGFAIDYDPEVLKIVDIAKPRLSKEYSLAYNIKGNQVKLALAGAHPLNRDGVIANIKCEMLKAVPDGATPLMIKDAFVNEDGDIVNIQQLDFRNQRSIPTDYALSENFPNPFNPQTKIRYQLPQKGNVVLKVFNLLGQEIRTLVNEDKSAGFYEVQWDGTDNLGQGVSSGIYVYRIQAGDFIQTKKLAVLK